MFSDMALDWGFGGFLQLSREATSICMIIAKYVSYICELCVISE